MAFLQMVSADGGGQRFSIDNDKVTIGRAADNDLVLDDSNVSSHHCQITRENGVYTLTDLGSTNGTTLNDSPVQTSQLAPGDRIQAGNNVLQFDGDEFAVEEAALPAQPEPAGISPGLAGRELPPGFELRRTASGFGFGIVIAAGVVILILIVWFVYTLLQS